MVLIESTASIKVLWVGSCEWCILRGMLGWTQSVMVFFLLSANFAFAEGGNRCGDCSCLLSSFVRPRSVAWNENIDFAEVEHILEAGEIVSITPLGEAQKALGKEISGSHPAYLLEYSDKIRAVWKPFSETAGYETGVDAYLGARLMGSRQVPPTVIRAVNGIRGSAQYYVSSSIDLLANSQASDAAWKKVSQKDLNDRKAFNFVFGQWDATSDNVIIDDSYSLALIDNDGISAYLQVRYGEMPFRKTMHLSQNSRVSADANIPFPFETAVALDHPSEAEVFKRLGDNVQSEKLKSFWERRSKRRDASFNFVIWQNAVWTQDPPTRGGGVMKLDEFFKTTLDGYRKLNFEILRKTFSNRMTDEHIRNILERRDQLLTASQGKVLK